MFVLSLSQAVDFTIALAVDNDQRYERAAGRLLGRIVLEQGLTLAEAQTVAGCFDCLPGDPDAARTVLMSWTTTKAKNAPISAANMQ